MDKFNFNVRGGMSRLPPGFRFQPTEEELVFQYLKCKVFSSALPASIIPEINVCKYDPWDLPGGDTEEDRYLFSNNEAKYRNGNRTNRSTPSGYWKATGSDRKIVAPTNSSTTVGMKKTLVFYTSGKACGGGGGGGGYSRTGWVMHEYRLVSTETCACVECCSKMEKWVLCRIFCKKMSMQSNHGGGGILVHSRKVEIRKGKALAECRLYDFMKERERERDRERDNGRGCISSTAASSSSSSSSFTEITCTRSGVEQSSGTSSNSNSDDFSAS